MVHAALPFGTDAHALVEFEAHVREGLLPHIVFFQFEHQLNSGSNGARDHFEEVLHSALRVVGEDVNVSPDLIQAVLDDIDLPCDVADVLLVQLLEDLLHVLEVLIHQLCVFAHFLVLF